MRKMTRHPSYHKSFRW